MEAVLFQTRKEPEKKKSSSNSLSAAISRSLASSASFYFSRPIRLFRPQKVSGVTALQALAHERGQTLSPSAMRSIWKDEGWRLFPRHVLPPFVANTLIGFSLFFVYSSSDFVLRNVPNPVPQPAVPFVAGALAGSAQAIISSPLDNVRMLLARRAEGTKFTWAAILREAIFPVFLIGSPPNEAKSRFGQLRYMVRWASRGWSLYGLTLVRDAVGFGTFFAVFEVARKWAKRTGKAIDRSLASKEWPKWLTGETEKDKQSRGWIGRTAQALVLVAGGSLAGASYGLLGRPFDVARREIWQGRMSWAEKQGLQPSMDPAKVESASTPRNRFARIFGSSFLKRRSTPNVQLPQLPSARSILRQAVERDGIRVFFFPSSTQTGGLASVSRLDAHPSLGGASVFTPSGKMRSSSGAVRSGSGLGGAIVKFFSVVPPYALGFLAFAIVNGDLSEASSQVH